jgi:hypothetical protein
MFSYASARDALICCQTGNCRGVNESNACHGHRGIGICSARRTARDVKINRPLAVLACTCMVGSALVFPPSVRAARKRVPSTPPSKRVWVLSRIDRRVSAWCGTILAGVAS